MNQFCRTKTKQQGSKAGKKKHIFARAKTNFFLEGLKPKRLIFAEIICIFKPKLN